MAMEETRRRNEASMARKRANAKAINPAAANSGVGTPDGALSPSSTGAMDSLLEKLRAAAPQAKDQRDRRRRARLKDKHQIRVASGQTIPDLGELTKNGSGDDEADQSLLNPGAATNGDSGDKMEPISEGEDVAERAASMLQGLRGDGDADSARPASRDGSGSLRVRRRRESADTERQNRRRRRARDSSSTAGDEGDTLSPKLEGETIPEIKEPDDEEDGGDEAVDDDNKTIPPPKTVVEPPSPEGTEKKPVVLDD